MKTVIALRRGLPGVLLVVVVCLGGLSGCRVAATRRNADVVRLYFDRWANHGDAVVADQVIAPDLELSNPPSLLHSLAEYKASMTKFHAAFPDLRFTVEDLVSGGDRVVVRWTLRGTHLGELQGRPPTGRPISITGTSTFRLESGRIRQIWVNMDRYGLMDQLGWLK